MDDFKDRLTALLGERQELRRLCRELTLARMLADRDKAERTVGAISEMVSKGLDLSPRDRPGAPFLTAEIEECLFTLTALKYYIEPSRYWNFSLAGAKWPAALKERITLLCAQLDPLLDAMLEVEVAA
jgi:hypothetical protein